MGAGHGGVVSMHNQSGRRTTMTTSTGSLLEVVQGLLLPRRRVLSMVGLEGMGLSYGHVLRSSREEYGFTAVLNPH